MMQRMEKYMLERAISRKNDLMETIQEWRPICEILAAISTATGSTQEINQIQRISSTHTAITQSNEARTGDRLGGYRVDFIIRGRRYNQLFLSREAEIGAD